jgi:hypothetical protein
MVLEKLEHVNIKNFKLTKTNIEILFNNITYYQKREKEYNNNINEKLEKELLRVRKKL